MCNYVVLNDNIYCTETGEIRDLKRVVRGWNEIDYFWFIEKPGILHTEEDANDKTITIDAPSIVVKTYPVKDYTKSGDDAIIVPAKYLVIPSAELVAEVNNIRNIRAEIEAKACKKCCGDCDACSDCNACEAR